MFSYLPDNSSPEDIAGHRLHDEMYSLFVEQPMTPTDILDPSQLYAYDHFP